GIRDWSVTGVQTCALPICDVFRNASDTRIIATGVMNGEGAAADPPNGPVRPNNAVLQVGEDAGLTLFHVFDYPGSVVRMDAVEPGARLLVKALTRPPEDLRVSRADVESPLVPGVHHPEDLMNVLGHLPKAIFRFAQCLLGPPSLVRQKAAPAPVQRLAQYADDGADQQEQAQRHRVRCGR